METLEKNTIGDFVARDSGRQPFSPNMELIFVAKDIDPSRKYATKKT